MRHRSDIHILNAASFRCIVKRLQIVLPTEPCRTKMTVTIQNIAQIIGDTHRGKTNYFLKLYLNFIPLQAMGRFHVGCSRVQLVSPCLTVVLGRSASEQGAWPVDLQVQQVPCPVENICSTSKYTILFREEKLWFWHRFEEGLHKNRQMRTLTANLAKLIPHKSFHGRSGACKRYLGPGWWNPYW